MSFKITLSMILLMLVGSLAIAAELHPIRVCITWSHSAVDTEYYTIYVWRDGVEIRNFKAPAPEIEVPEDSGNREFSRCEDFTAPAGLYAFQVSATDDSGNESSRAPSRTVIFISNSDRYAESPFTVWNVPMSAHGSVFTSAVPLVTDSVKTLVRLDSVN